MNLLSLLLSLIVAASIRAVQGIDNSGELYHAVFLFSNSILSYDGIVGAMYELVHGQDALGVDDPRRAEVSYWIEAKVNDVSKCTIEAHQDMMARLEGDRVKAEEARRASYPNNSGSRFNLEYYVNVVRSKRFMYCQNTVGYSFSRSFDEATLSERKDLDDLTEHNDWLSDKNPKKLGKRVARFLHRKMDHDSFMQLSESADSVKHL